jgi:hypothetical protein
VKDTGQKVSADLYVLSELNGAQQRSTVYSALHREVPC